MRGCVWACGQAPGERRERRGLHSQGLGPHGPGCILGADGPVPQALLPLALEGTDVGQTKAAQALAKLTITSNPEMTFPGERVRVFLPQPRPVLQPLSGPSWPLSRAVAPPRGLGGGVGDLSGTGLPFAGPVGSGELGQVALMHGCICRSTRWSGPSSPCCTSTAPACRTSRRSWL